MRGTNILRRRQRRNDRIFNALCFIAICVVIVLIL